MEQSEVELLAAAVRRAARVADGVIPRAPELIEAILGSDAVGLAPALMVSACLVVVAGRYRILVREIDANTNFDLAYELARAVLRGVIGFGGPREERQANALAAAMIAPAAEVRRLAHLPLRTMATAFGISQTAMFLRLGEVQRDERAVVTRSGNVIIRSQGAVPWATMPLACLARGRWRWQGVSKTRLHGGIDEGRIALLATG